MMRLQILFIAPVLLLLLTSCIHSPGPFDEAAWRNNVESRNVETLYAAHFKDGMYFNPWMPMENAGFGRLLKWKLFSAKARYTEEEKAFRPAVIPNLKERIRSLPEGDFIAWIGHASFLMRLQGEYWLTDPHLSERAFVVKRVTPPAITAAEIRELTPSPNILISHNHYDHLDKDTLRSLPEGSRFFVPRGLKAYVEVFPPGTGCGDGLVGHGRRGPRGRDRLPSGTALVQTHRPGHERNALGKLPAEDTGNINILRCGQRVLHRLQGIRPSVSRDPVCAVRHHGLSTRAGSCTMCTRASRKRSRPSRTCRRNISSPPSGAPSTLGMNPRVTRPWN